MEEEDPLLAILTGWLVGGPSVELEAAELEEEVELVLPSSL